jgi:hypothetical protein
MGEGQSVNPDEKRATDQLFFLLDHARKSIPRTNSATVCVIGGVSFRVIISERLAGGRVQTLSVPGNFSNDTLLTTTLIAQDLHI